jgi:hypothetical protein
MTASNSASAPTGQRHGLDVGHVGCHRLEKRSGRGDDDAQWRAEAHVVGMA